MTKILLAMAVLLTWCNVASAQQFGRYVFGVAGPVVVPQSAFTYWNGTYLYAGGGIESRIGSQFAMGGEAGVLRRGSSFGRSFTDGMLSATPAFHLISRDSKSRIDPFINGGISVLFNSYSVSIPMIHFGGGINYVIREHLAVRVEFRHHIWSAESGSTVLLDALRSGIVFGF
jgi:hypothetical protein